MIGNFLFGTEIGEGQLQKPPTQIGEIFSPIFCLVEEILNPKQSGKKISLKNLAPFIMVKITFWDEGCQMF